MINLKYWGSRMLFINLWYKQLFHFAFKPCTWTRNWITALFSGHETIKFEFCLQYRHYFVFRLDTRIKGSLCSHNLEKQSDKLSSWEHFLERVFLKNLSNLLLFSRPYSVKLPRPWLSFASISSCEGLTKAWSVGEGKIQGLSSGPLIFIKSSV